MRWMLSMHLPMVSVLPGPGKKMPLAPTGFPTFALGTSPHCIALTFAHVFWYSHVPVQPASDPRHVAGMKALLTEPVVRQAICGLSLPG